MRELVPGSEVAGYRIHALVGRGGMGVVYRATQLRLERVVALKVIAPELLDDEDVRARFLTEARLAASVDHPNIIPVHEAGDDDGVAYIAMRFVAGPDLRTLVRRGGALDPPEAAGMVAQASNALDAIHRAGFVHRDVKPANLLVDPSGHVYLTDFGLAKQVITRSGATRTGHWVGTLDYVAPEQIRGGRIDARADVYALGGVLHYALTGRVPFERQGDEAKLWAQLSAPPPVPSEARRGLRPDFDVVVVRAMAKEPDDRYPSAGDLGRAARAAAAGAVPSEPERVVARGAAAPGAAPSEPGLAGEAQTRTAPKTAVVGRASSADGGPPGDAPRLGPAALIAAAAAVAAAIVLAVVLVARGDDPSPSAEVDPTATATATATASVSPSPTQSPAVSGAHVVKTTPNVGIRPNGIALAGRDLWVTSAGSAWLTRVSATTGRERGQHPKVGVDARAIVSYRDQVWVAVTSTREVLRIDARTGAIRSRLSIAGKPIRLSVARSGIWVGTDWQQGGAGQLLRYDLRTGALLQTIVVNEGVGGVIAAADAIWVIKSRSRKVARLEPGGTVLVDWVTLPGPAQTMRYGDGKLWVTYEGNAIARIGPRDRSMVTTSAGNGPAQLAVARRRVFVASRNDQTVITLDPRELAPIGEPIRVGLNPFAMVADARSVWVTGLGDNTLTRIDYR